MDPDAAIDPSSCQPTRVRFAVLGGACALAVVTYIHRVGFATASAEMRGPLQLSDQHLGMLMAAFMVAYGLFEIPWGYLSDRLGVRIVLAVVILGGSVLTAVLPLVGVLPRELGWIVGFLLVVRFLFGAFQAGTFPAISRLVADWMPAGERGGAQGVLWMSSRLGGAIAPSLLVWLFALVGDWRAPLVMVSALGFIWCAVFCPWFRNRPHEMPQVNAAEQALISARQNRNWESAHRPFPLASILRNRSVWSLCLMYGFLGYSGNFFLTLLPSYLKNHRGFDSVTVGYLTSLPFAFGVAACLVGGAASDALVRRWKTRWSRPVVGASGMAVAALAILGTIWASDVVSLAVLLCLTFVGNDLAMGPAWAAAGDLGGRHTGTISGTMNMMASFTAAAAALVTGTLFDRGFFVVPFAVFSASYLLGVVCWLGVDVTTPLLDEE